MRVGFISAGDYSPTADPEGLFFAMTQNLLPPIAAGIMTAAVLSAIMSTADSMLLVGAAAIAHDLKVARRFPGRELLISRVAMITLAVAAVVTAIFMPASIFNRALFAWVAIGSAFGPVLIVRLAGITVAGGAVFAAMSISFVLAVTLYLLPNTPGDIAERILPFFTGTAILLLWRERN